MFSNRNIPIFTLLFLCCTFSFADDNNEGTQEIARKNILITKGYSTPNATTQSYSGDSVINIVPSADDMAKSLDQLIAENTPSFIHTNSGTTQHKSNNIHRGLSDAYTLYLLNGVPFPTSTTGSQEIPNIPMESIALVEVIRGAQSSLYGSNSLTGVINIVTKTGEIKESQRNISAGSNNTQRIGGVFANNIGKLQLMASLDADKSDGYNYVEESNNDFGYKTYSMNNYLAYVTESNRFSLSLNNARTTVEINDSLCQWNNITKKCDYEYGQINNYQETLQLTGKYIQRITQNLSSEFTLSRSRIDLEAEDYWSSDIDNYSTDETMAQLHLNNQWQQLIINLGGEFIHSQYKSNTNGDQRNQAATYIAMSHDIVDSVSISAGLRDDYYSDFGNALTYSAGLSLFNVASLSYKTSFSAPSYNDLYWPGSGNPDLAAEEGRIIELSLTHNINTKSAYIPLSLNVYTGSLSNKINWAETTEDSGIWSPFNIGKVSIKGVEAYMQYNASAFIYELTASYTESIDQSTREQLNNVPYWSASSSFQYNINGYIQPKIVYSYIGSRQSSSSSLKASHIVDFAINYQITAHVNGSFKINNMTDNKNKLYDGYNADGRTFMLTIGITL